MNAEAGGRGPTEYPSPPEVVRDEGLLAMAARWGIGDDYERELAIQNASEAELTELAKCLDDVPDRFWEWLAGPESYPPEPSGTYIQMSILVEAVDFARAHLRRRD